MQVQDKSVELARNERLAVNDPFEDRMIWIKWLKSSLVTSLGGLLGLAISAISLASVVNIRRSYVWFLGGLLVFQSILIVVIWVIRKKNRGIARVKENLTKIYVSQINRSSLNPDFKSSEL